MMVKVGFISSIDYENYKAAVVFKDRNNGEQDQVSIQIPFFMQEFNPPNVDDQVVCIFRENAPESGFILWRPASKKYKPPEGFQGLFRRWFSRAFDKCYIRYTDPDNAGDGGDNDGTFLLHNADKIRLEAKSLEQETDETVHLKAGSNLTLEGVSQLELKGGSVKIDPSGNVTIQPSGTITLQSSGAIAISGSTVSINNVNFSAHTHICAAAGSPSLPPV
jgi:phage baseplate assembly protein gpV